MSYKGLKQIYPENLEKLFLEFPACLYGYLGRDVSYAGVSQNVNIWKQLKQENTFKFDINRKFHPHFHCSTQLRIQMRRLFLFLFEVF